MQVYLAPVEGEEPLAMLPMEKFIVVLVMDEEERERIADMEPGRQAYVTFPEETDQDRVITLMKGLGGEMAEPVPEPPSSPKLVGGRPPLILPPGVD